MNRRSHKETGVALLMALLIVALVAALSYVMMTRLGRDTQMAQRILESSMMEGEAQGSIAWAEDVLIQNMKKRKPNQAIDVLPIHSPEDTLLSGDKVKSTIESAEGYFNLNDVQQKEYLPILKRLMQTLMPALNDEAATAILKETVQWTMPGADDTAFARYYRELPIPYRPSHRFFTSASEWRMVKGVTPELYDALAPYLIALPKITKINVATAAAPLLVALSPNMTLPVATQLVAKRDKKPFLTLTDFQNDDLIKNHPIPSDVITIDSSFFLVKTTVTHADQTLILFSLMMRQSNEPNKISVKRVWQSRNAWS